MDCPNCGRMATKVIESRQKLDGTCRRRRQCECGHRFSTIEVSADKYDELMKIKWSTVCAAEMAADYETLMQAKILSDKIIKLVLDYQEG